MSDIKQDQFIYHLCGTDITECESVTDNSETKLPEDLVIAPGLYFFEGKVYNLQKEGLYRFIVPLHCNHQRIVYKNDIRALTSALSWIHSHGDRDDEKDVDEIVTIALTGKVIMTCGPYTAICVKLLTKLGIKARAVGGTTLLPASGYNDGHILTEVFFEGRWAIIDMDQHVTYKCGGRDLSLVELVEKCQTGDYQRVPIALSAPYAIADFKHNKEGYDYGMWMETKHMSEEAIRQSLKRILMCPHINGCYTLLHEEDDLTNGRLEGYTFLEKEKFIERFYGNE